MAIKIISTNKADGFNNVIYADENGKEFALEGLSDAELSELSSNASDVSKFNGVIQKLKDKQQQPNGAAKQSTINTKSKINVLSLSSVNSPDENAIYTADAQDWKWRNGQWYVVKDISNVTDLSTIKPVMIPPKGGNGFFTVQPTIYIKDGEEGYDFSDGVLQKIQTDAQTTPTQTIPQGAIGLTQSSNTPIATTATLASPVSLSSDGQNRQLSISRDLTKLDKNDTPESKINEALKTASEEYNAKLLAKGKADNKIAKTAEIGNTAMNVAGGVLGLGQMIGGAKILGKTKAPKYPYEQLPNQQLSARLGDVQRLSQIGDPIIREKMMRDMAMQNAKNDAVAKVSSGGDVASYAAQSQVNSSANNDAIRNIGASELAFKTQQGGILDGLIAQKIQEDNARQKGKIDKFGIDYNEFKAKRNYGEQLVNKGIGNVFNAGIGAGQNATVLARTKQNEGLFNKQEADAELALRNSQSATPQKDAVYPNVTEFGRMILPSKYNPNPITGLGGIKTAQVAGTPPTIQPTFFDKSYNSGDMAYMATPQGYSQYTSKVAQIPKDKIMYQYQNTLNPATKKPYTYEEIIKGMTDGKIGSKHRMAQTLINELGL